MEIRIKLDVNRDSNVYTYEVTSDLEESNVMAFKGSGYPFLIAVHGIFEAVWKQILVYQVRYVSKESGVEVKQPLDINWPGHPWA